MNDEKETQCGVIVDPDCLQKLKDELTLYKLALTKCAAMRGCSPHWALPQRCDIDSDCINCVINASITITKKELGLKFSVLDGAQ